MDSEHLGELSALCTLSGFTRKGTAFFRVMDGGVLEVIKYSNRTAPWKSEEVFFGLFSLYGEIDPQWLTSGGCIPRYNALYLKQPRWKMEMPYHSASVKTPALYKGVFYFEYDRDCMLHQLIPFLNSINSQQKLIEGLEWADYVDSKWRPKEKPDALMWTDALRFSPYLFTGQRENAARVIESILATYSAQDTERPRYKELRNQYDLVVHGTQEQIEEYLNENFRKNQELIEKKLKKGRTNDEHGFAILL